LNKIGFLHRFATGKDIRKMTTDLERAGKIHFRTLFTALKFASEDALRNWFGTPLRYWQRYGKNDVGFGKR